MSAHLQYNPHRGKPRSCIRPTCSSLLGEVTFREARSASELLELLRLRHRAMRASRLRSFVDDHPSDIDLDCFDLNAHHYGLFRHEIGGVRPIGYQRGISLERSPHYDAVLEIADDNDISLQTPTTPFPSMAYLCDTNLSALTRFLREEILPQGRRLVEGSRLTLCPTVRGRRIGIFAVEATVAAYLYAGGFTDGVLSTSTSQKRFYSSRGFHPVPGAEDHYYEERSVALALVHVRRDFVPATIDRRLRAYGDSLIHKGYIRLGGTHND